jgi:sugar (pentulose or hexulose) kinase
MDVGTSSVKAAAIPNSGYIFAAASDSYPTDSSFAGAAE